jgi:hypothetical protein
MDPRNYTYPLGVGLCIVAIVLWFRENAPLGVILALAGIAVMLAGEYHSR